MTKFKAGDIVVGNQDSKANGVEQGQLYEVVATEAAGGYDYIQTNSSLGCWVLSERFDLYKAVPYVEQDDPLPPAPESVLYIGLQQHVHRRLQVKVFTPADGGSVVDLHIGGGKLGDGKSCTLNPDAALQLAHDLNRMAMEIKRKEKQQERKTTLNPAIVHPYGE
ncbi:hypothetical protein IBHPHPPA_00021 [Salmonella phage KKP 3828]|uniref:Uncharacterized protein n=1 Tax=Salmonella phage KKP 3828 TaxID=3041358 RepID=A0AA50F3B3_9CAUD|nr:hypothetical protein IBHPHPPA_00021 [Salmonella phage KKP 3828]